MTKMTAKRQKAAIEAFNQGLEDEKNNRASSARLLINHLVRDFYDAARKQQADLLAPEREAAQAAREAAQEKLDNEANARIRAKMPQIEHEIKYGNPMQGMRLAMNAMLGI